MNIVISLSVHSSVYPSIHSFMYSSIIHYIFIIHCVLYGVFIILLYFILFYFIIFYYVYIVVPTTTSHLDLVHEKDSYIAQLTRKLQTVTKEKEEIITTLQTQLQEYKQQNLPSTPQKTTGLLLL